MGCEKIHHIQRRPRLREGAGISLSKSAEDKTTITNTETDTWRGIDDTPVDGENEESISSNWAYDHTALSSAHHTVAIARSHVQLIASCAYDHGRVYFNNVDDDGTAIYTFMVPASWETPIYMKGVTSGFHNIRLSIGAVGPGDAWSTTNVLDASIGNDFPSNGNWRYTISSGVSGGDCVVITIENHTSNPSGDYLYNLILQN